MVNSLDIPFYLASLEDKSVTASMASEHFEMFGIPNAARPNPFFSAAYVRNVLQQTHMKLRNQVEHYFLSGMSEKVRLLFVSHDASRTGAPAIILRLIEMFSELDNVECYTILDEGGDRLGEFEAVSHTYVMKHNRFHKDGNYPNTIREISDLFAEDRTFRNNRPVAAIINSAESLRIAEALHEQEIPIISLLHEVASYYPASVFKKFYDMSEQVILPSQFIKRTAIQYADIKSQKLCVRGQGLLQPDFGSLDAEESRDHLLRDLSLTENAFIVLNVGTKDQRKGIDYFVDTATLFFQKYPDNENVHFVWYGGGEDGPGSPTQMAREEIARHDIEDRVHFRPPTGLIEPKFLGADLFYLSARADPFPCVIHEAMACSVPIIAFRNGGGAPELIGEDCGTVVDYADIAAVVAAIHNYCSDPTLLEEHGAAARQKIADHWDFADYFADIADIVQSIAPPGTTFGENPDTAALPELIVMGGKWEEWETVKRVDLDIAQARTVFVDGRFSGDIPKIAGELIDAENDYVILQPKADDRRSRSDMVTRQIFSARPEKLTIVDMIDTIDFSTIKLFKNEKRLLLTSPKIDPKRLYRVGRYFDTIFTVDPDIEDKMRQLNPLIADRILSLEC